MEEGLNGDPLNVTKEPEIIKEAQASIGRLDVLVCGDCHEVFHFVEEFKEHKEPDVCKKVSNFKCENNEKPQVWGFTLWKTKQLKLIADKKEEPPTSWDIYQNWCKLTPSEKDLWISAGQSLQYCLKTSNAIIEKVEEKETVKEAAVAENKTETKKSLRSEQEKEEFIVESIVSKRFNPRRRYWEYEIKWKNYDETTFEPIAHLDNCKDLVNDFEEKLRIEKEKERERVGPTRGRGRPKLNSSTPVPSPGGSPVKPTQKKPQMAFSPIITGPGGRPQRSSKQKALNQVKQWCGSISDEEGGMKRPFEDVDDESDEEFEKKLKLEAESEDTEEEGEMPLKKVAKIVHNYNNGVGKKLPDNVLIPDAKGVVRISQKQLPSLSSGVYIMSKSSGIIKLDAAASKIATSGGQAIVKVNPKVGLVGQTQVKVIKKDDGTKTRILQVKPKVDMHPIKTPVGTKVVKQVVQKVTSSPLSSTSSLSSTTTTATATNAAGILQAENVKKIEKVATAIIQKANKTIPKTTPTSSSSGTGKKDESRLNDNEDESDDGLEELEFPTDLPLPQPDSPPGEFVLDPSTGKIAGQEYPEPEPEKPATTTTTTTTTTSATNAVKTDQTKEPASEALDNIVKLAAADITEEDLKPDDGTITITQPQPQQQQQVNTTTIVATLATTATPIAAATTPKSEVYTVVTTDLKQNQSILNAALANSNILQKTLQSPRPKPKILNQSVAKPRTPVSSLIRNPKPIMQAHPQHHQQHQQPQAPIKPRFNVTSNNRNVYTKTNSVTHHHQQQQITRKVGNTNVHKTQQQRTSLGTPQRMVQQGNSAVKKVLPSPSHVAATTTTTMQAASTSTAKQVISMPSLTEEEPQQQIVQQAQPDETQMVVPAEAALTDTDLSFALADGDRPVFITGDDGTVYQVAGQNEEGQTILLTQDSNGQQQCLLVTNELATEDLTTTDNVTAEVMMEMQEPLEVATDEQPVVAQFVRTEPLSPGGTHRVVVMLPNGECIATPVSPEEYASLELGK